MGPSFGEQGIVRPAQGADLAARIKAVYDAALGMARHLAPRQIQLITDTADHTAAIFEDHILNGGEVQLGAERAWARTVARHAISVIVRKGRRETLWPDMRMIPAQVETDPAHDLRTEQLRQVYSLAPEVLRPKQLIACQLVRSGQTIKGGARELGVTPVNFRRTVAQIARRIRTRIAQLPPIPEP